MADKVWSDRSDTPRPTVAAGTVQPDVRREDLPWLERPQHQLMLDFRFASGDRRAFQYFDLVSPELLGGVLKLYFHHATVSLHGRHLGLLHDKLLEHKVYAVLEQHQHTFASDGSMPYIERIEISPPNLDALARKPYGA